MAFNSPPMETKCQVLCTGGTANSLPSPSGLLACLFKGGRCGDTSSGKCNPSRLSRFRLHVTLWDMRPWHFVGDRLSGYPSLDPISVIDLVAAQRVDAWSKHNHFCSTPTRHCLSSAKAIRRASGEAYTVEIGRARLAPRHGSRTLWRASSRQSGGTAYRARDSY